MSRRLGAATSLVLSGLLGVGCYSVGQGRERVGSPTLELDAVGPVRTYSFEKSRSSPARLEIGVDPQGQTPVMLHCEGARAEEINNEAFRDYMRQTGYRELKIHGPSHLLGVREGRQLLDGCALTYEFTGPTA